MLWVLNAKTSSWREVIFYAMERDSKKENAAYIISAKNK